jgi:DNA-binding CsgD family transcriptional regulator
LLTSAGFPFTSTNAEVRTTAQHLSHHGADRSVEIEERDLDNLLYAIIPPHFGTSHQCAISGLRDALGADRFAAHAADGSTLTGPSVLRELDAYLARTGLPEPATPASPDKVRTHRRQHRLTDRQGEVVRLLARGLTNKEIAQELGVTPKTVMHHTVAIDQEVGLRGRSETVAWAIRTGAALEPG